MAENGMETATAIGMVENGMAVTGTVTEEEVGKESAEVNGMETAEAIEAAMAAAAAAVIVVSNRTSCNTIDQPEWRASA
jgi:hypothetical protein